jgi:hypothetical protein
VSASNTVSNGINILFISYSPSKILNQS